MPITVTFDLEDSPSSYAQEERFVAMGHPDLVRRGHEIGPHGQIVSAAAAARPLVESVRDLSGSELPRIGA